jgi:hypothetical protein
VKGELINYKAAREFYFDSNSDKHSVIDSKKRAKSFMLSPWKDDEFHKTIVIKAPLSR